MFIWPITKAVGDHYLLPGALTARSAGARTEKNRPEYGTSKGRNALHRVEGVGGGQKNGDWRRGVNERASEVRENKDRLVYALKNIFKRVFFKGKKEKDLGE